MKFYQNECIDIYKNIAIKTSLNHFLKQKVTCIAQNKMSDIFPWKLSTILSEFCNFNIHRWLVDSKIYLYQSPLRKLSLNLMGIKEVMSKIKSLLHFTVPLFPIRHKGKININLFFFYWSRLGWNTEIPLNTLL